MSDSRFPPERAYDLLRYARHYLADEGLISQDELHALILAPSSSARRLESYDEMRQKIAELKAKVAAQAKEIAALREDYRKLRILAALRVSWIANLYHDDGELQDASAYPVIDWVHDDVGRIEEVLRQRALLAMEANDRGEETAS